MQKLGIVIIVVSLFGGLVATGISIYLSFGALEVAETAGICAVGDHMRNALLFSAAGIVGTAIGSAVLIFGGSKNGPN